MSFVPGFDEQHLLHNLQHYLPAQAPLKDFVHHNTLHEFQDHLFHEGLAKASKLLGYRVYLSLGEYRALFDAGKINPEILRRAFVKRIGDQPDWKEVLLSDQHHEQIPQRIGALRAHWKEQYQFDLNGRVHVNIFRILNSFLDQGVALKPFPAQDLSLLEAVRYLERNSFSGFFRTDQGRVLLHDEKTSMRELLDLLVGDPALYEQYVFDQQFEHPGWSGLVAVIEQQPHTLLDRRKISLRELILLELMLEVDTLNHRFGESWKPLAKTLKKRPEPLFEGLERTLLDDLYAVWQDAYEWSYYDEVLAGLKTDRGVNARKPEKSFQALFCIDDREISLRDYIESMDENCETFGTPGHFGIDTYYQPQDGKFHTKICPLPLNPKHIICERESEEKKHKKDVHYNKRAHSLLSGWIIAQTVGFWSAFKLFVNIFRPALSPASASAFKHMDASSFLTIESTDPNEKVNGFQVGYTVVEMADRVETVLKSIGLVNDFAPLIYVIGHGASSTNNTHFAAYDCGACSGRPGSVNARAFSYMANHSAVRELLNQRGIVIPDETVFLGGLHDTTCDDIHFYDVARLSPGNAQKHLVNQGKFNSALELNAKERSRRFDVCNTRKSPKALRKEVKLRSVSLFEPRPEYNHATNTLCIVGRRSLTSRLCLDRRSFLNSYDYKVDPDGKYLLGILNAAAPVCGGINLEYYFSRVDNQKLGAGSKLPHNVMGLIGVANGIEGDLRPGLPQQMIEIHDPLRLLIVVEHKPDLVLDVIKRNPATYEWFIHEWVHLVVIDPETHITWSFVQGKFEIYEPLCKTIPEVADFNKLIESTSENFPVFIHKSVAV